MKSIYLFLLLLLCALTLYATPVLSVDAKTDAVNLSSHLELFVDKSAKLTFSELSSSTATLFHPTSAEKLSLGYTDAVAWIRFSIKNSTKKSLDFALELPIPWINFIDVYKIEGKHVDEQKCGSLSPASDSYLNSKSFFIPFSIAPEKSVEFYIRFSGEDALTLAPYLYSKKVAQKHNVHITLYIGALIGVLVVMTFFYLILSISLKDRDYFYYAFYLFSLIFMMGSYYGYNSQIFWPDAPLFNQKAISASVAISLFAGLLFSRKFLNIERVLPKFDMFLQLQMGIYLVLAILSFFAIEYHYVVIVTIALMGLYSISLLYISIKTWSLGVAGSGYFILAWSMSLVSSLLAALMGQGYIGYSHTLYYSFGVVTLIDIILLAYALVAKINTIEKEKFQAQKSLVEREKELARLNYQDKKKLEEIVSKRTQELLLINKKLEEISVTDKLTKLYNRVKLDKELLYALEYAERYQSPFSLILLDIDYFKSVNDAYGHLVGDTVLIEFANILKFSIRNTDFVGRWGGEEFLVICPKTDKEGAISLVKHIQTQIRNIDFSVVGKKTASFGVTTYYKGDTPTSILKRTDDGLYRAKESGRDTIVFQA